ncbi:MAG TPA: bifunctional demethylmenaquinone methyltransferase/2-methoxy-6-polyprenyl-1,4-benzoquinol methylase UbiE [Thermoanaerobaculia bacterium]|nr:bifunctional demethylmenaquinone methyltransferase/2-methoxy-6-polyprenyl-1,4-benzoquinol methylase UbiE [Thermoanaerobaculia bacterium]
MTNKYLSYDDERAPKVREMFSRLAERYDLVNDVMSFGMHRHWKRETVRLALNGRKERPRMLDLCCGTGDMTFRAGEMKAGRVVGADFTIPMLAVARRRANSAGARPDFVAADALSLPFRDASFDAITVGYGLRNIADPRLALAEMRRVLAPGGRAVILDFGKPDNPVAAVLYNGYLRTMMPAVGWIFHRDPQTYSYIPDSLERYPAQRGVETMMRDVGFANVRYENRFLGTMGLNIGEAPGPGIGNRESGIGSR